MFSLIPDLGGELSNAVVVCRCATRCWKGAVVVCFARGTCSQQVCVSACVVGRLLVRIVCACVFRNVVHTKTKWHAEAHKLPDSRNATLTGRWAKIVQIF
jgi:hypothetical protein